MRAASPPLLLTGVLVASVMLGAVGCATSYAYRFEPASGGDSSAAPGHDGLVVLDDAAVLAEVQMSEDAVDLRLTNRTDDVLQVAWSKVVLERGNGTRTALHPEADLGWAPAGATLATRLVPFVLPRSGSRAAGYEGRLLALVVPVVVRHEPRVLRFELIAHVRPL